MRAFLSTPLGRCVSVILCLVGLIAIGWSIHSNLGPDPAVSAANNPLFINAETGKVFRCKLTAGMNIPVKCPDTGKETGYEAELCFWTKDGRVKNDPTPVLLNEHKGLPGPTFCPDCGRLVVHHNPMAVEGGRPPPTEREYRGR